MRKPFQDGPRGAQEGSMMVSEAISNHVGHSCPGQRDPGLSKTRGDVPRAPESAHERPGAPGSLGLRAP
eukprot:5869726-Pyramimonas_sp.AAC.1